MGNGDVAFVAGFILASVLAGVTGNCAGQEKGMTQGVKIGRCVESCVREGFANGQLGKTEECQCVTSGPTKTVRPQDE